MSRRKQQRMSSQLSGAAYAVDSPMAGSAAAEGYGSGFARSASAPAAQGRSRDSRRGRSGGNGSLDGMLVRDARTTSVLIPRLMVIFIVVALLAIGLVMVYSASSVYAYEDYGDPAYFFKRQLLWVCVGLICCALVIGVTPKIWATRMLDIIWVASVALLVLTVLFGYVGLGAKRWITIGPVSLQPSEFAKIAMMLLAANILVRYKEGELSGGFKEFVIKMFVVVVVPAAAIIIQPDLGTTLIALVTTLAVFWFGEVNRKWIYVLVAVIAVLAVVAIVAKGFRSTRILAWLHPEEDPYGYGYQTLNSCYAFSNGGIFGVGLGNSTQKYEYLTYAYNDFIFAVIGEETGIVGAMVVIALYFLLAFFSFRIGAHADSQFGRIVCDSAAVAIVFQALLNIGCTCRAWPITGKPLPFISYGGSSMIATMILVGIILSVSFKDSGHRADARRGAIRERSRGGRVIRN